MCRNLSCKTDGCIGATTTVVRDHILRYNPQIGVFSGSHINEKVKFIVQDAVLDQPTNVGSLRVFTHMRLICDPGASVDGLRYRRSETRF